MNSSWRSHRPCGPGRAGDAMLGREDDFQCLGAIPERAEWRVMRTKTGEEVAHLVTEHPVAFEALGCGNDFPPLCHRAVPSRRVVLVAPGGGSSGADDRHVVRMWLLHEVE